MGNQPSRSDGAADVQRALARSEARLAGMLEITPAATVAVDADQRIVLFNDMAEQVFGYTREEVLGRPLDVLLPPEAAARHRQHVTRFGLGPVRQRRMAERQELTARRKSGELFPAQIAIARVSMDDETLFLAVVQDLTERKETERRLKESEERFRLAFEHAPIGVALLDAGGAILEVNRALCAMLGYAPAELAGRPLADLAAHPGAFPDPAHLQSAGPAPEVALRHRDGRTIWAQLSCAALNGWQSDTAFILQLQDITDRKRYEEELVRLAMVDSLTDLANRRRFQQELEEAVTEAERTGRSGALVFIDLDMFKHINDTLGHPAGDEVLRQVATILRSAIRPGDTAARLGGDEFALVLRNADGARAAQVADRLLTAIRRARFGGAEAPVSLTASMGVVLFPEHGRSVRELMNRADMALLEAKEGGRDSWAPFTPEGRWQREMQAQLLWRQRISRALEEDRFVLHYQPILDLRRNTVTRHEALLRMVGDGGELIFPGEFMAVAERFDLIQQVDRWVLERAVRELAELQRAGRRTVLEVNLSGRTLMDPVLPAVIRRGLTLRDVDPASLVLEITETAAISDVDQAERFIGEMKALGCRLALDDVGAGFASLYFLKRLPVDYIKIDGAFIRNLPHDTADQHLVRALANVCRELGKQTVAEFVDSPRTLQVVREYGIDYAQGYLIGRPGPGVYNTEEPCP
ncbi:putative bifunctional diguanylate cyclase/phosphodiesterase [Symbiobacterium thermophilum]|uniref:putative bifunctional diguanylate cyclase/phosphodiesterase n=1 Tax=Symbiobacterium thermophilum TaxID=2734 RepID=UPI0035C6B376